VANYHNERDAVKAEPAVFLASHILFYLFLNEGIIFIEQLVPVGAVPCVVFATQQHADPTDRRHR
jgi:hypothetical protein